MSSGRLVEHFHRRVCIYRYIRNQRTKELLILEVETHDKKNMKLRFECPERGKLCADLGGSKSIVNHLALLQGLGG